MPAEAIQRAHRERFAWMKHVLADADLTNGEKLVALRLALYKNLKTGRCDPSVRTIARGVSMRERNVQYILRTLEEGGWIKRRIGGGGPRDTTQYDLVRVQSIAPLDGELRMQETDATMHAHASKGAENDPKGRTTLHPNLDNIEQSIGIVGEDPHSPDFEIVEDQSGSITDAQIEAGFEEFWKQCPRQVDKGKARSEYRKVVGARRATISQLLHAMMLYAAARHEADQDYYTKAPATWLANECWNDDPKGTLWARHAPDGGRKFKGSFCVTKSVLKPFTERQTNLSKSNNLSKSKLNLRRARRIKDG
jgi:hypothetical protein